MRYITLSFLFLFFILGDWTLSEGDSAPISGEIFVNPQGGSGIFRTIQDAINKSFRQITTNGF